MKAMKTFETSVAIYQSQKTQIFDSATAGNSNLVGAECFTSLWFIKL